MPVQWPTDILEIVERRESNATPGAGDVETAGAMTRFTALLSVRRVGVFCIAVAGSKINPQAQWPNAMPYVWMYVAPWLFVGTALYVAWKVNS